MDFVNLCFTLFSEAKMVKLEEVYSFNSNNNCEIKSRWIRLGLRAKWDDAVPRAVKMVTDQGRMKYLRPIFRYNLND
jgi:leukotriene-A4 hydrolase